MENLLFIFFLSLFSSHYMKNSAPKHASTMMHCFGLGTRLTSSGGWILWMWLARSLSEKPLTMILGLVSSAYTGFLGSSLFGCSPSWTWREGEELEQGGRPWLLLGMEREEGREWGKWEGVGRRGRNGDFCILINFEKKKNGLQELGPVFRCGSL